MIEILGLLSLVCMLVVVVLAIIILLSVRRQGGGSAAELFKSLLSAQTRKELGEGMDRLRGGSAETQSTFQKTIQERMDKYRCA